MTILTSLMLLRIMNTIESGHEKTCLISAFVVRCLDSVMSLVSVIKISSLMLASVSKQATLSLTWSETPEDTFSHDEAQLENNEALNNLVNLIICLYGEYALSGRISIMKTSVAIG